MNSLVMLIAFQSVVRVMSYKRDYVTFALVLARFYYIWVTEEEKCLTSPVISRP